MVSLLLLLDTMVPSLLLVDRIVSLRLDTIASGWDGLFETGQFGRFSIASGRDGRAAIVGGQNGTF